MNRDERKVVRDEDEIVANPQPAVVHGIHEAERDLLALRQAVWPQREAINTLVREEGPLITDTARVYLRYGYGHYVQIMASNFMPLTFMAIIYGMNFEHMPELRLGWGYPLLLAAMVVVAVGMIVCFRRGG